MMQHRSALVLDLVRDAPSEYVHAGCIVCMTYVRCVAHLSSTVSAQARLP